MRSALFVSAAAATVADSLAFVVLVVPGASRELNPVVGAMHPEAALWARACVLVAIGLLAVVAHLDRSRRLRLTVGAALVIATVIGALGAVSTIAAAIA